jgi:hypothetical protein
MVTKTEANSHKKKDPFKCINNLVINNISIFLTKVIKNKIFNTVKK